MLYAICDIELQHPYGVSLNQIHDMVRLQKMKLLTCSTRKRTASIAVPVSKFKEIFGANPRIASYDAPEGTQGFMMEIVVREIRDI